MDRRKVMKVNDCMGVLEEHEDLLVEILSKLPVESLLRCRSVSKRWYALTKTPYFISKHFAIHRHPAHHPFIIFMSRLPPAVSNNLTPPPTLGFSLFRNEQEKTSSFRLPFESNQVSGYELLGSSNGLVCLSLVARIFDNDKASGEEEEELVFQQSILVWNPATEQYRCLPKPNSNSNISFFDQDEEDDKLRSFKNKYLLSPLIGFDFIHDRGGTNMISSSEYKLVRVFWHGAYAYADDDPNVVDHGLIGKEVMVTKYQAQVFVRNTNSWRPAKNELHLGFPPCRYTYPSTSITLNGVLYWKVDLQGGECCVMSFDLRTEVFNLLHLPTDLRNTHHWGLIRLFSWRNSLATMAYLEDDYIVTLWMMSSSSSKNQNESKTTTVWTPQLRLNPSFFPKRPHILGGWKDELVFTSPSTCADDEEVVDDANNIIDILHPKDLFSYDPKTQTMTPRNILKHGERIEIHDGVLNYVHTLAPV